MNGRHFDTVVQSLTTSSSRRAVFTALAGGALGVLLARGGIAPTRAAQRPDRDGDGLFDDDEVEVYGTNPDVFDTDGDGVGDGEEVYLGTDPLTPAGGHCPVGLTNCFGICIDVLTSRDNCGGCFVSCGGRNFCVGGACVASAPSSDLVCAAQGLTDCGGVCTNTLNDSNNCGACFTSCPLGAICSGGVCQGGGGGCLALGSQCVYGVDVCCGGACLNGICTCSPPRDVCGEGSTCCSGVCDAEGFCA